MSNPTNSVRVKSIHVKQLFGIYNHDIDLSLNDEHITVIHGPNGVGKTVLFKLTLDLLDGIGSDLIKYPFAEFRIVLTNDAILKASKKIETNTIEVSAEFKNKESKTATTMLDPRFINDLINKQKKYGRVVQIDSSTWLDLDTDETLNSNDMHSRFDTFLNARYQTENKLPLSEWRNQFNFFPKVHLVQTQRLIKFPKTNKRYQRENDDLSVLDTVKEYSQQLKQKIDTTLADYGKEAQKLDQTFPQRLLNQGVIAAEAQQIEADLKQIENKQRLYQKLGLIDVQPALVQGLDQLAENSPVKIAAMTVYITDMKQKLAVLDSLANRVNLLLSLINEKFTDKKLYVDKHHELAIRTSHGDEISVTALSSGEQHQIVLAYDMLFSIEPNALVMIDEPELSLHVNWQERFLTDLKSVIEVANFDALIATHSPYIINGRNDLVVRLSVKDHSKD